jgi:putative oxidoreductase
MLYGHGLSKFYRLIEGNLSFANPIGIGEAPTLVLAVFSEFLAPVFILIGYKTKIFSFFPAATMFVAAFIVHLSDPFARKEKAILFLIGFIVIMMMGPGKYSIDRKFS